jgi:molybdopterin molybdotransferase
VITLDEAQGRVRARTAPLAAEAVGLADALGRVLAADLIAGRALPPFDDAAMDGFAARAADLPGVLPIHGAIAAGHPAAGPLPPGTAVRIATGGALPAGADCVVMREDADDRGDRVGLPAAAPGAHVRRAGEDVAPGQRVLSAGVALDPGAIGLLAALGRGVVEVGRRPRVAILPTGDELVALGAAPGPGQRIESNGWALAAQVREAGGLPDVRPTAPDEPAALAGALALDDVDVLLTSGGVSVGDRDHVRAALEARGVAIDFAKVAMKPGKPILFGTAGRALVFGLPGNPVSSMIGFELFVRPALRRLQGARVAERPRAPVVFDAPYRKAPGRLHVVRVALRREDERLVATPHPRQGSAMISSMATLDALAILEASRGDVAAGETAIALLLGPA